jgi:MFS transporter, DHA1 family, multidrug resistance protein
VAKVRVVALKQNQKRLKLLVAKMRERREPGLKASVFAALALAFASLGDAFLYPFLPINSNVVGIPVVWVGVLLSVNRFVRIFSNTLMVRLFAMYGIRVVVITAVICAIVSTFGYGMAAGVIVWLILRGLWGLAFSAMRMGTIGYALKQQRPGLALGISKGIQEAGPVASLFMAPVLLHYFEPALIFFVLGTLSLPALYCAWMLPKNEDKIPMSNSNQFLNRPSTLNSITFVSAILIDGVIVIVLGVLFLHYREHITLLNATTLAAFYLGYRRICLVILSPAGGWMADHVGLDRIFNFSISFVIIGLIVIVMGWIGTGAVIVFTFYGVNSAITPGSSAKEGADSLAAVAENATWRDIGAALGTVVGGILISSSHLITFLVIAIFVLTLLVCVRMGATRNSIKFLYQWK